ncbi:MAG: hypothetical protein JW957_07180 [Candidatus Omnitrophica bacterium]|nr:hypothetical protein [Candidatus Omnitrophota bacterium]
MKYAGWQVGITYQTKKREGLDKKYLRNLLREMKDNGMNFVSFMVVTHGLNDVLHDGYTWPVRNKRLRCYMDKKCTNAGPKTEFLTEIIEEAAGYGFHVNLTDNQFWWNPKKAKKGYPLIQAAEIQGKDNKAHQRYPHCADNSDTWRMACDAVEDLFGFYASQAVKSYAFEMIGRFQGCTCPDTMKMFKQSLKTAGLESKSENKDLFSLWEDMRRKEALEEFVIAIKKVNPSLEIWHHGYMELTDRGSYRFSPASYEKAGVDVALPCIHQVTDEDSLKKVLDSSKDFPLVLHVDTRDVSTLNYNIPLKNQEYILSMGRWIEKNNRKNLTGIAFFNEPATSAVNKKAVYKVVKNWRKKGLLK